MRPSGLVGMLAAAWGCFARIVVGTGAGGGIGLGLRLAYDRITHFDTSMDYGAALCIFIGAGIGALCGCAAAGWYLARRPRRP